ncbi:hypothetical protein [Thalassobacillus devorans]|uniref:hypothetical protein n=1 Tax=Thalassobacillus devorans TaxID=279813 RepID=UPI000A1C887A|nr:hypothetical protein [Thalassobacillus devorans]
MINKKSKFLLGVTIISVTFLLLFSFFIITSSYFHSKEIGEFTAQCYERGGEVLLEIHNSLTSSYSFECKMDK